jgi:hypothetical protein
MSCHSTMFCQGRASAIVLHLSIRNPELETYLICGTSSHPPTMPPAFLIVRLETNNQLLPTIRRSEAVSVWSTAQNAIRISGPNYAWDSTRPIPVPDIDCTHVTFNVAIEKRDGDVIEVCGDSWDYFIVAQRLFELAAEEVSSAVMMSEEHELATIFKTRSNEARACMRSTISGRIITWQVLEINA